MVAKIIRSLVTMVAKIIKFISAIVPSIRRSERYKRRIARGMEAFSEDEILILGPDSANVFFGYQPTRAEVIKTGKEIHTLKGKKVEGHLVWVPAVSVSDMIQGFEKQNEVSFRVEVDPSAEKYLYSVEAGAQSSVWLEFLPNLVPDSFGNSHHEHLKLLSSRPGWRVPTLREAVFYGLLISTIKDCLAFNGWPIAVSDGCGTTFGRLSVAFKIGGGLKIETNQNCRILKQALFLVKG